jgi:hypothetical protein
MEWIAAHVRPTGPPVLVHQRPWSTVSRVPTADGVVWFKECAPVQGFEPSLSAGLSVRWPERVAEVIAHDEDRAWLLMRDAGRPVREVGNPPELWLAALPLYAELQRAECAFAADHVDRLGVPDLRLVRLADRWSDLVARELPVEEDDKTRLAGHLPDVERLCADLATSGVPDSIQHDDLHMSNLYVDGCRLRVLDWGDSSVSHPFASLVVTFRFLREHNGLSADDPWFARLRDAYLEPWGTGRRDTFDLGLRVGAVAHAVASLRQRDALPEDARHSLNPDLAWRLRMRFAALRR